MEGGVNFAAYVKGGVIYYVGPNESFSSSDLEGASFQAGGDAVFGGYGSMGLDSNNESVTITVGGSLSFFPSNSGGVGISTIVVNPLK